ncbi:MAG: hypothetical protein ACXVA9_04335 [Bdellovibrionales bacterium]
MRMIGVRVRKRSLLLSFLLPSSSLLFFFSFPFFFFFFFFSPNSKSRPPQHLDRAGRAGEKLRKDGHSRAKTISSKNTNLRHFPFPFFRLELYCPTMRSTQISFFDKATKRRYTRTQHGGATSNGKRKLERPLGKRNWIHLVLKSDKAVGKLSFLNAKNKILVEKIIKDKGRKFGVSIADQANVGNHIHLKIRITSRTGFQKFLKSVTTLVARKVTGARKGKPFGRFWQGLAFTRVLKSYTEELNLKGYFVANRAEANVGPEARDRLLKAFNRWVYHERTKSSA